MRWGEMGGPREEGLVDIRWTLGGFYIEPLTFHVIEYIPNLRESSAARLHPARKVTDKRNNRLHTTVP